MATETYPLKANGVRVTDMFIDWETQTPEEVEALALSVITEGPTKVMPPEDVLSVSIDTDEKFVEVLSTHVQ